MANDEESNSNHGNRAPARWSNKLRWVGTQRKIFIKRRKLPTVRLGEKNRQHRRMFIVRLVNRIRLRWLELKYSLLLKKLKHFYYSLVKEILEGASNHEVVQQRILMESYLSLGLSLSV